MNVTALILCTVALGADARETIPTSQKLFEVIDNTYLISKRRPLEISEDGTTLQPAVSKVSANAGGDERPPYLLHHHSDASNYISGKYALKVVACPGFPNFLVAGYVIENPRTLIATFPGQPSSKVLHHCYCVLIDTDRNIVVPLDDPRMPLYLNQQQIDDVQTGCQLIWYDYLRKIDQQEPDAPFYEFYWLFRRQFVTLPQLELEGMVYFKPPSSDSKSYPSAQEKSKPPTAGMKAMLQISADGRVIVYEGEFEMQRFLSTTIAEPAAAYFAKPAIAEATEPTVSVE
ncbi:hypothetical protein [Blastopirellula retiformator]|uniref:Uncharacterized protein n=1 Tax=Blastopirellula retiformator TaxID=2527970 RepID=A0A5C5V327_9BACT|nr:hypothetical protein [Blastopirellula retiformator]TWT32781.1 hypothetical protein Enr8_25870 [Blastopirellula retiformator]